MNSIINCYNNYNFLFFFSFVKVDRKIENMIIGDPEDKFDIGSI